MDHFIGKLAAHIVENYTDLSKLTLVLPSQRAEKYIQKALHELYGRPFFSPSFLTIDDFARSFVDAELIDPVELLFRFFKIYKKLGHDEDFETFLNWAPMLIADCNDIDRYLVDANQLFKNLRDVRELENWSFGEGRELSASQKQFLAFWDQLKDFYHEINTSLKADGLMYAGGIMRNAAEHVLEIVDDKYPNQKFIFAGFNALSEAEIQLMSRLVQSGRAEVILEADRFYLNNLSHEAGLFIRRTKERIPKTLIFMSDALTESEKNLVITSCSQAGSMLKVTQDLLSRMSRSDLNETVLLLADESLIVPAIKHIPKSVEVANITLGLPLKLTALRSWIELVFEFQSNFEYFKTEALYHKTLTSFFKHPFVEMLLSDDDRSIIQKEEANIIRFNKIFTKVEMDDFSDDLQVIMRLILAPWRGDFCDAIARVLKMNSLLFSYLDQEIHTLERSAIFHFHAAIQRLELVFGREDLPAMTLRSFEKFFNMRWMRETVAYYGNPIDGLQVMGMLETRLLNFKNVIVVGLNEGILPPKNVINSLIPLDLRRYFNLPLPADKDAIFAHHFYRLLSASDNVQVLYATNQGDDLAAIEPSRYLQQIELELQPLSKITITHNSYNIPVSESLQELGFTNTAEVQERILTYFQRGFSPSALNKFLKCPLDFYVRYVLKYSDDEDVEEGVESSTFGDVVHKTLEELYQPFAGEVQPVKEEDIQQMLVIFEKEVEKQFRQKYQTSVEIFDSGAMYFALLAAKKQVRRYLEFEKKLLVENPDKQLFILALEADLNKTIEIRHNGVPQVITISGKIDRIDRFGSELRIIDYKTGKCETKDVTISGERLKQIQEAMQNLENYDFLDATRKDLDQGYVLQLLFYLVLYASTYGHCPDSIGILSMRNLQDGLHRLNLKPKVKKGEIVPDYPLDFDLAKFTEFYIASLAERILSLDVFQHNPKAKYCLLCNN